MTQENVQSETQDENNAAAEAVAPQAQEDELAAAQAEAASLKDQLLRQMAETENVRRRLEREKQDAGAYAVTSFARDILAVADNLRRALDAVPEAARADQAVANVITGIEMTEREVFNIFNKYGIAQVEALGQKLDPNKHQAMLEIPTNDAEPGTVVQVLQTGFVIKGRLLRPALVAVAKAADAAPGSSVDTNA
ncbi:MAG TPA: nucleotide exchange factor GrpE [Pedomonas sp.]|uniref:nucleotide exchange factor GrpE n=1 Tax=Pedomonas sp. TaxID=2976421 RepID=UPI002F402D89